MIATSDNSPSFALLDELVAKIQTQFDSDFIRMQAMQDDLYFLNHAHIAYSHIFRHLWSADTSHNLLQAFAHKGTIKSLIYILRAIFGSDVQIVITSNPNEVGLAISNTNQEATLGLALQSSLAQALDDELNLALLQLNNIQLSSIDNLIIEFLPAGVKLVSLQIT